MGDQSRRRRWGVRSILLSALLATALLASLALAPAQARTRADAALGALIGWLWPTRWAWPLVAALTLAALATPLARRLWPRPARRVLPAVCIAVGLVGLSSFATVRRPWTGVLAFGAVAAVGLLTAWVLLVPRRLAPPVPAETLESLGDRARLEVTDARVRLRNDLRTTALHATVALAALLALAALALGVQQLTKDRQPEGAGEPTFEVHASERFARAIDQLGSDRREVQLAGVYELERIAQQAPANRLTVTEVLVAYLHRRVPQPARPRADGGAVPELRLRASDAQGALTVLGRRRSAPTDPPLDLRGLDLRHADLGDANLFGADLTRTDLRGADLRRADLSQADLHSADLRRADLSGANLRGTDLTGADLNLADLSGAGVRTANLSGAGLIRTDLRSADLTTTYLSGADLSGADLSGAELVGADLPGADLPGANLFGANLFGVDLRGADLRTADLSGVALNEADLSGSDLSGAGLVGADLRGAAADQETSWPEGFDPWSAGVQEGHSGARR
jgi:uncharacterized protein YjbI with pentapeptide repeats